MSKKIKLQDLSISNFEQPIDVEGIKGGGIGNQICVYKQVCRSMMKCFWLRLYCYNTGYGNGRTINKYQYHY